MEVNCRIVCDSDVDRLIQFEEEKLNQNYPNEVEREMARWRSKARPECLKYYAQVGWSFLAEKEGELLGFVLAQPLSFLSGFTQSLWVEYLSTRTLEARDILVDVMYRLAREKHLQGVYFPSDDPRLMNSLGRYNPEIWKNAPIFVHTTKKSSV